MEIKLKFSRGEAEDEGDRIMPCWGEGTEVGGKYEEVSGMIIGHTIRVCYL